jgi:hypothetical protein
MMGSDPRSPTGFSPVVFESKLAFDPLEDLTEHGLLNYFTAAQHYAPEISSEVTHSPDPEEPGSRTVIQRSWRFRGVSVRGAMRDGRLFVKEVVLTDAEREILCGLAVGQKLAAFEAVLGTGESDASRPSTRLYRAAAEVEYRGFVTRRARLEVTGEGVVSAIDWQYDVRH